MTTTDSAEAVLVVRRMLPVAREHVFAAWLNPVTLAKWMLVPGGSRDATVHVEPHVGGTFHIVMHGTKDYDHTGEYLVIEPPSRLSFTWISAATERQSTVVNLEFLERGKHTELVLTHRRLPAAQIENHRQGWTAILGNIERTFATAVPDSPDSH